ncbi:MAG: hypothetical protein KC431_06755, partial [Myxococcales bacterium]|nr:hypothetical protein [Myxococcales bacterium]
ASIEGYLAPQVGFETISEARERCLDRSELLFDGPALERGFLCDRKLARSPRRRAVYASDLMHAISDVPTVRAIQRLTMAKSANGKAERWALEIAEDGVPTLAAGSKLVLLRDGLPLPLDEGALSAALSRAHARSEDPVLPLGKRDITVVAGRDRDLGRYHSLLNQLPLVYGVGPFGLPASATPARRAQAKQLRAFVAFFDQILANCFAQLAHARELFSHYGEAPRTYFGQVLEDPAINFDALRLLDRGRHQVWLDEAVVDTAVDELGSLERRARFLGHLLARYAEELDEVDVGGQQQAAERTMADIRRKLAFLRDYPRISAGRGSGYDVFRPNSVAGMAQRLRLELGVPPDAEHPGFEIVEHLLLRPVAEDRNQKGEEGEEAVPLLAGVDRSDPYSMQLAVVFREPPAALGKHHAATYEQLVERLVAEHTPAHLGVTLHWFGDETGGKHWSTFLDCHRRFREALAAYREPQLRGTAASPEELQLA